MHTRALLFEFYCKLVMILSVIVIVISIFVYVTFLLLAVGRTEVRTNAEVSIKEVASDLGSVQAQYIVATQSITPQRATGLGFVRATSSDVLYVNAAAGSAFPLKIR